MIARQNKAAELGVLLTVVTSENSPLDFTGKRLKEIFVNAKVIMFCFLIAVCINTAAENSAIIAFAETKNQKSLPEELFFGTPEETDVELSRRGFSLGYSNSHRQPLWVCYILSSNNLAKKQVKRSNLFRVDPAIKYHPVKPRDYSKTGYDKGHLAAAADMTYSVETMNNSFFMSNISPQIPGCNRGIWKRLENIVRMWAVREEKLCIVTGPLFKPDAKNLGKTNIPVPYAFYKVILDLTPPMKMIGFIIPNQPTKRRLPSFVVTVDEIEKVTGYDFFSELPDVIEEKLEAEANFELWNLTPLHCDSN